MRRNVLLACGAVSLAALVACAASDPGGEDAPLEPVADSGSATIDASLPDGGDAATAPDVSAPVSSTCNDDGWCATELPDTKLRLIDVWPFADRAFAVAESDTLGTKVLEWTEASQTWTYVDDDSQNAYGGGEYAGKMYAPSENEVYFTTAPGLVFHGTRASVSATFTWESTRLPYDGPTYTGRDPGRAWRGQFTKSYATALGVAGTSAGDVYAWYGNRIFRRSIEDGGAPAWVSELVTEDAASTANESFYIFNASPASSDEIWFVGAHGPTNQIDGFAGCPTLFRRTSTGYSTVLDFTYSSASCATRPGTIQPMLKISIPGWGDFQLPTQPRGWATAVAPVAPGAVMMIIDNELNLYYVDTVSGIARLNSAQAGSPPSNLAPAHSVVRVEDRLWFSGHGRVFGSEIDTSAWSECLGIGTPESFAQAGTAHGATMEQTSVAMNGSYLNEPLYQVRGSSLNNLWAVGNRHALHKKIP